jgi:hypothetical protein
MQPVKTCSLREASASGASMTAAAWPARVMAVRRTGAAQPLHTLQRRLMAAVLGHFCQMVSTSSSIMRYR